ncbi:hypothetical protein QUB05_21005 [Microcoleus sp. F10-C6]|uniref:hypothetical protein n=1 Tax=unclassified Microcoleus TaxID=2642155 RepID=UPI002FD07463
MLKGLIVQLEGDDYAFYSNAKVYEDTAIAAATGILAAPSLPNATHPCPYRIEDLLQARVMYAVKVRLKDGTAGKTTNRRLYISKEKRLTYRSASPAGLVGAIIDGKTVLSAMIPRKASFRI